MYKEVIRSHDDKYGGVKGGGPEGKEEEKAGSGPQAEPKAGEEEVGGELGEEVVFQSHLEALIAFCGGDSFQASLEAFKRKHVQGDVWRRMAESKEPEKEEQPLEFTDVFREYTELIESALEKFAGVHGIEAQELYHQARDAMEGTTKSLHSPSPSLYHSRRHTYDGPLQSHFRSQSRILHHPIRRARAQVVCRTPPRVDGLQLLRQDDARSDACFLRLMKSVTYRCCYMGERYLRCKVMEGIPVVPAFTQYTRLCMTEMSYRKPVPRSTPTSWWPPQQQPAGARSWTGCSGSASCRNPSWGHPRRSWPSSLCRVARQNSVYAGAWACIRASQTP